MTHVHYRRLLSEICALIGVPCDDALASHGTLRIADFDVLLVCDGSMPHYAAAYFDLGPLPEQGKEALQADMLEINHSIGPSCKGVLSVEPRSQRVLCALPFEDMAIVTGHPIVNGTSGSTNIMAFMLRHLSQTEPNFDARSALLGTMVFLVFDGGHSFNEAMAVSDTIDAHPGLSDPEAFDLDTIMERKNTMGDYFLDYQRLAELSDRDAVDHALDTALTKTPDYFDAGSYFIQRNNEIVDVLRS